MHATEKLILNKFKREPLREISTDELAREAHPQEYSRVSQEFYMPNKEKVQEKKLLKAKLHRSTLYHLNSLVESGILRQGTTLAKGEKTFRLAMDQGELVISRKHTRIVITKPTVSTALIDDFEKKGVVHKYDPDNWLGRVNCVLLEPGSEEGLSGILEKASLVMHEVNDCIGIADFEKLIDSSSEESLLQSMRKLELDASDHARSINLLVNLGGINSEAKIIGFAKAFALGRFKNTSIVLMGSARQTREKGNLLKVLSCEFQKSEVKLNFQNTDVKKSPILVGRAGTYAISDIDFARHKAEIQGKPAGLSYANLSIAIDVSRFYKESQASATFRDLVLRVGKTLLKANMAQMRKSSETLKRLNELSHGHTKKFYSCQKSYIRFWNYNFKDKKHENFLELLESCKEEIESFSRAERAIYNACGLPINFDIVFSSTLNKFSSGLTSRNYTKTTIRSFKEYENSDAVDFIKNKERLSRLMLGSDRTRIFRKGDFSPDNFARELSYLLSTYDLPLLTFDFKETTGELKLTSFLETEEEE